MSDAQLPRSADEALEDFITAIRSGQSVPAGGIEWEAHGQIWAPVGHFPGYSGSWPGSEGEAGATDVDVPPLADGG